MIDRIPPEGVNEVLATTCAVCRAPIFAELPVTRLTPGERLVDLISSVSRSRVDAPKVRARFERVDGQFVRVADPAGAIVAPASACWVPQAHVAACGRWCAGGAPPEISEDLHGPQSCATCGRVGRHAGLAPPARREQNFLDAAGRTPGDDDKGGRP